MFNTQASTHKKNWRAWLPVFSLAFSAFIFITTELIPIGLLPDIARSFSMDVAHTGLIITGYAWVVALLSLPLTILTANLERRKLLMILFCIFIAAHILAGFAWSFAVLMLARICIAFSHAIFWSITIPLAARIAPNKQRAKALALMVTGLSLATVLGVPIGTLVGQHTDWRMPFFGIAAIALLVMLVLARLLPELPSSNAGSLKSLPSLLKRPALISIYILCAIIITGHFTAYSYITPFMREVGGFSEKTVVFLLLLIGAAAIIGSYVYTRTSTKYPSGSFAAPLGLLLLCLTALYAGVSELFIAALLCICWSTSTTMLGLSMQSKVLVVAEDATDVAMSMYSGIFNIGIGAGALMGSKVLLNIGIFYVGFIGAIFIALAMLFYIFYAQQFWSKNI